MQRLVPALAVSVVCLLSGLVLSVCCAAAGATTAPRYIYEWKLPPKDNRDLQLDTLNAEGAKGFEFAMPLTISGTTYWVFRKAIASVPYSWSHDIVVKLPQTSVQTPLCPPTDAPLGMHFVLTGLSMCTDVSSPGSPDRATVQIVGTNPDKSERVDWAGLVVPFSEHFDPGIELGQTADDIRIHEVGARNDVKLNVTVAGYWVENK